MQIRIGVLQLHTKYNATEMRESNDVNCQGDEWMIIISVAA